MGQVALESVMSGSNEVNEPYRSLGLPKRLVKFFTENPDEELTIEMGAIKFDARPAAFAKAVHRLVESGVLESVKVVRLPAKGRMQEGCQDG